MFNSRDEILDGSIKFGIKFIEMVQKQKKKITFHVLLSSLGSFESDVRKKI